MQELREISSLDDFDGPGEGRVKSDRKQKPVPARQLERQVVDQIIAYLKGLGCVPVKNHGTPYAQRGRPDIDVDIKFPEWPYAAPFHIEVKRDAKSKPTKQQERRIEAHLAQGSVAFVASDVDTVREAIETTHTRIKLCIDKLK